MTICKSVVSFLFISVSLLAQILHFWLEVSFSFVHMWIDIGMRACPCVSVWVRIKEGSRINSLLDVVAAAHSYLLVLLHVAL